MTFENMILRTIIVFFIYTVICSKSYGQKSESVDYSREWNQGSIFLTGGKELKGKIKYNYKIGQVLFDDDLEVLSFTADKVTSFEFYDSGTRKQKNFYTLPFDDRAGRGNHPLFFELLSEFKNFSVLSRHDPISFAHHKRTEVVNYFFSASAPYTSTRQVLGRVKNVSQTEIICIRDTTGNIKPYTSILYSDKRNSFEFIDKGLLEETVGTTMYKKLKVYAAKNRLKFRKKNDLIIILEYYGELIK